MAKSVIIIAGGPSLIKEDVEYAEKSGIDIIGINDAYRICNRLTYLYACDRRWWFHHYSRVSDLPCKKISLEDAGYPRIEKLEDDGPGGLSLEWPKIRTGRNSGYQAINLAILLGYKKIILLGYDMQHTANKVHWFGDHPKPLNNAPISRIKSWREIYNEMIKEVPDDVEIINASRETALKCFQRASLKEAIDG